MYYLYIGLIILTKLIFIILALTHLYLKFKKGDKYTELDKKILYYKQKVEFIFIALMSCLIIYLFNPRYDRSKMLLTTEIKYILFLFGILLLVTANWGTFIKEPLLFKNVQFVVQ